MDVTLQPLRIAPGSDAALIDWFAEAQQYLRRHDGVLQVRLLQPTDGGADYLLEITWRQIECAQQALRDPQFVESLDRIRPISTEKRSPRDYRLVAV